MSTAKTWLKRFLNYPLNSKYGLRVSQESQCSNYELTETSRPSVLRQFFGKISESHRSYRNAQYRYSYGIGRERTSNTLFSDINEVTTRILDGDLLQMSELMYSEIKENDYIQKGINVRRRNNAPIVNKPFNHVTVLLHIDEDVTKVPKSICCPMSGCTFDKNGTFKSAMNSQVENSIAATLTIGHSRVVKFYARQAQILSKGKYGDWERKRKHISSCMLHDGDIMLLHPDDERPFMDHEKNPKKHMVQIQHKYAEIDSGKLSVCFIFRHVDNIQCYGKDKDNLWTYQTTPTEPFTTTTTSTTKRSLCNNKSLNKRLLEMLESYL